MRTTENRHMLPSPQTHACCKVSHRKISDVCVMPSNTAHALALLHTPCPTPALYWGGASVWVGNPGRASADQTSHTSTRHACVAFTQSTPCPNRFLGSGRAARMQPVLEKLLVLSDAALIHLLIQLTTLPVLLPVLHMASVSTTAQPFLSVKLEAVAALRGGTAIPVGEAAGGGGGSATGVKPPCAPVQGARL